MFIDGIAQLSDPHVADPSKPQAFQVKPRVPNFDDEARAAVEYEGLPPLEPEEENVQGAVVFMNVRSVFGLGKHENKGDVVEVFRAHDNENSAVVVVEAGMIKCIGQEVVCLTPLTSTGVKTIDTEGGSIAPGLVTFGAQVGLEEIEQEKSTGDGRVFDPLVDDIPDILGPDDDETGAGALIKAADGLQFGTRNALCVMLLQSKEHMNEIDFGFLFVLGWHTVRVLRRRSLPPVTDGSFPALGHGSRRVRVTSWPKALWFRRRRRCILRLGISAGHQA